MRSLNFKIDTFKTDSILSKFIAGSTSKLRLEHNYSLVQNLMLSI